MGGTTVLGVLTQMHWCDEVTGNRQVFFTDSLLRCPSIAFIFKRQRNRDLMIFIQLDNEDLATSGGETGHHRSLSQAVHKNVYLQALSRIPQCR